MEEKQEYLLYLIAKILNKHNIDVTLHEDFIAAGNVSFGVVAYDKNPLSKQCIENFLEAIMEVGIKNIPKNNIQPSGLPAK